MPWLGLGRGLAWRCRDTRGPPPIHQRDRPHPDRLGQGLRGPSGGSVEDGPLVVQEGLRDLTQIFDEMKAVYPTFKESD
jgi:hypothetical protein